MDLGMPKRLLPIMVIAFVVASGCSWLVYKALVNRLAPVQTQAQGVRVVVAATDIKLGSVLRPADLGWTVIQGTLPKGAILKQEDAVGRGVIAPINQGEAIVDSRLAAAGSGGGLAATIPQGKRAIAVKVYEVIGVAGFVTPGQHVDVLISGNPPDQEQAKLGTQVRTLLQNIEVLSAGQDIQKDAEGKPQQVQVVNLLVSPDEAEELTLASAQTRIQLILRNPLDTQISKPPGSAMSEIFSGNAMPIKKGIAQAKPKPDTGFVVEVMNGNKRSEAKFNASESKQ